jgi:hypothetical protein
MVAMGTVPEALGGLDLPDTPCMTLLTAGVGLMFTKPLAGVTVPGGDLQLAHTL